MKRLLVILLATALLPSSFFQARGDEAANAAAIAQMQDYEARYRKLSGIIEDMLAAQAAQQRKMNALAEELRSLREEMARAQNNGVTAESLRRLSDSIRELDNKRLADNQLIREQLEKLRTVLSNPPAPSRRTASTHAIPPVITDEAIEHTVARGDTLSAIVQTYRSENIKVTQKMVMDANPNVKNWDKVAVGTKIIIPKPKP